MKYSAPQGIRHSLATELNDIAQNCIECRLCVNECLFLEKYGTPKEIALSYDPDSEKGQRFVFDCSLCLLCEAVCPPKIGLNPASMFLEMRRESVDRGKGDFPEHRVILGYEKRGTSKRYSYYGLPEKCDTIFFPGCTLPATRPDKVMGLFDHIRKEIPNLGIVFDCCTKPSHDLGREKHFHAMFGEMKTYLVKQGIKRVFVACPSCFRVFEEYGGELQVMTVYEYLADSGLPVTANIAGHVTIHDSCSTRYDVNMQQAVRKIALEKSLNIKEMKHHGRKALCCGEGGSVGFMQPVFSKAWSLRRKEEAQGTRVLTYCAGCTHYLNSLTPASHIVDVIFDPEKALSGKVKVARAPFTYLNRIFLKRRFKKKIKAYVARERTYDGERGGEGRKLFSQLGLLSFLVAGLSILLFCYSSWR